MSTSVQTWREADGDNTYAINWPLDAESHVVEVGGFEGRWSKQIYDKYGCYVDVYEPQEWAAKKLDEVALTRTGYNVHNYALGETTKIQEPMGEFGTDACSFLHVGDRVQGVGSMLRADMALHSFEVIDLMMINIEGYEYKLLEYMIECGLLKKIKRLCIQWHEFADPTGEHRANILFVLEKYFRLLWSFYPTLEAWEHK